MKCSNCGAENEAGVRFCIHCGSTLSLQQPGERPIPGEERDRAPAPSLLLSKKWLLVLAGAGMLVLCIGAVAVLLLIAFLPSKVENAALESFRAYAESTGVPYRGASARTLEQDSAFARVQVQAEFRRSPDSPWFEKEATVTLRYINGEWIVDSPFVFTLTERQQRQIASEHRLAIGDALDEYLLRAYMPSNRGVSVEVLDFEIVDVRETSAGILQSVANVIIREQSSSLVAVEKSGSLTFNLVGREWRVQGGLELSLTGDQRESLLNSYSGTVILRDTYASKDSLYLVDEDTDKPALFFSATGIYSARWSPDGNSLLVVFTDGGYRSAFVARGAALLTLSATIPQDLEDKTWHSPDNVFLEEEQQTQPISTGLQIDVGFADWSPTGEYILLAEGYPQINQFYIVRLEDMTYQQTDYFNQISTYLGWLPDGQRIAFIGGVPVAYGYGTGSLAYGQTVEGSLSGSSAYWTFSGRVGDTVSILMEDAYDSGLDAYVCLYGPDGTNLICDDDSGGGYNSLISYYTLPYDGRYQIEARGYGSSYGSYRLTLSGDSPGGRGNLYLFDVFTGQSLAGFDDPDQVLGELTVVFDQGIDPGLLPVVIRSDVFSGLYWNSADLVLAAPSLSDNSRIAFAEYGGGITYGDSLGEDVSNVAYMGAWWTANGDRVLSPVAFEGEQSRWGIGVTDYPAGTARVLLEVPGEDVYSLLIIPSPSGEHYMICAEGDPDRVLIVQPDGSIVSEVQGTCIEDWESLWTTGLWDSSGEHFRYYDQESDSTVIAQVDGEELARWPLSDFGHFMDWTSDSQFLYGWLEEEDTLTLILYDAQNFDVVQQTAFPPSMEIATNLGISDWKLQR